MNAHGWLLLSALRLMRVSSNDEPNVLNSSQAYSDVCKKQTRSAHLGSSVLLPCILPPNNVDWVMWAHGPEAHLVHLKSEGRIKFLDHRFGRLKAFPNQGSLGNYSLRIDELRGSDLGRYRCSQGQSGCVEVELLAEKGAASGEETVLIYTCVGVAAFALLCIAGYCCMKCMSCCCDRTEDNTNNPGDEIPEVAKAPQEGTSRGPTGQQQSDRPDPDRRAPTRDTGGVHPGQLEGGGSQRAKQGFQRELFNRLRNASMGRQYYANQSEIWKQQQATSTQADNPSSAAAAVEARFGKKKKAKKNGEIRNPIYNQSTEQLNLL
uniref:uncharacterized protein LOC120827951 isoform X2 n=1 Tax=Gasterosteus aculeatus aculeatus TaxID=481459 RepID=UPI001A986960|nr:uncharacterized protein LOC120827951 isoform X2 [Gasterosteus aculeatus aculeatus]